MTYCTISNIVTPLVVKGNLLGLIRTTGTDEESITAGITNAHAGTRLLAKALEEMYRRYEETSSRARNSFLGLGALVHPA